MADTRSIKRFLTEESTRGQRGVLLFMSLTERDAWVDLYVGESRRYSAASATLLGVNDATLDLVAWEGDEALRTRLASGAFFDRFWSEGEVPQRVGEIVLERCV